MRFRAIGLISNMQSKTKYVFYVNYMRSGTEGTHK